MDNKCDAQCPARRAETWLVPMANGQIRKLQFCNHHANKYRDAYEAYVSANFVEPAIKVAANA